MARVEGLYWVRERAEGQLIIAAFHDGEWTFGDGETFDDESNLTVVEGPLEPPTAEVAATWKDRYAEILKARRKVKGKDPLAGWDYLDGYYWVRVPGKAAPLLAQYFEGWGAAAGEEEFTTVEVIDGPLIPPQVAKRHVA